MSPNAPASTTTAASLITVLFKGTVIDAIKHNDDHYVVVKRICDNLGLDHASQWSKLKSKTWATVAMITTVGADGKDREMFCLSLKSLPAWLFSINTTKVKEELRPTLELYQREAADFLYRHLFGLEQQSTLDPAEVRQAIEDAVRPLAADLFDKQAEMERRLRTLEQRPAPAPATPPSSKRGRKGAHGEVHELLVGMILEATKKRDLKGELRTLLDRYPAGLQLAHLAELLRADRSAIQAAIAELGPEVVATPRGQALWYRLAPPPDPSDALLGPALGELEHMQATLGTPWVSTVEIVRFLKAEEFPALQQLLHLDLGQALTPQVVGYGLRRYNGRMAEGRQLLSDRSSDMKGWRVEKVGGAS